MLLEGLTSLVHATGVVGSALFLALLSYLIKFGFYRRFDVVDVVVAFSELPAVATATCGSLLVAALYLPTKDTRLVASYLMASLVVFLINLLIFRTIEERKFTLKENKVLIGVLVPTSYFFTLELCIYSAVESYTKLMI